LKLAFDIRVGSLQGVKDSKKVRERICKYTKRDIFFSSKKYEIKRRFTKDVEGEVETEIKRHIPFS